MQHQLAIEPGQTPPLGGDVSERLTGLSPQTVHQQHEPFPLVAQLHLPPGTQLQLSGPDPDQATRLVAPDGSWCEVAHQPDADGRFRVAEAGSRRLWRTVEHAHRRYADLGEPGWQRFGVTASTSEQRVWLDDPNGEVSWPVRPASHP